MRPRSAAGRFCDLAGKASVDAENQLAIGDGHVAQLQSLALRVQELPVLVAQLQCDAIAFGGWSWHGARLAPLAPVVSMVNMLEAI